MNACLGGRTNEVQATVQPARRAPQPSRLFVFTCEREDSLEDAHFLAWPASGSRRVTCLPTDITKGARLLLPMATSKAGSGNGRSSSR